MQLYQLREPTGALEAPGIPVEVHPVPHIRLGKKLDGSLYKLPLSTQLAEGAKIAKNIDPEVKLVAADLREKFGDGSPILVPEWGWEKPKARRPALLHLDTEAGVGGKLRLTGPHGAPEVLDAKSRGEVRRSWLPFSEAAGVTVISNDVAEITDDGVVRWKEQTEEVEHQPPLLLMLLKGASFRVHRTGELCGAPAEFTIRWDGTNLHTQLFRGSR